MVGSTCSSTNNAPTRSASNIKIDTTTLRSIITLLRIGIDASTPKAQTLIDTARSECKVLDDTERTMVSTARVVNAPNERKSLYIHTSAAENGSESEKRWKAALANLLVKFNSSYPTHQCDRQHQRPNKPNQIRSDWHRFPPPPVGCINQAIKTIVARNKSL